MENLSKNVSGRAAIIGSRNFCTANIFSLLKPSAVDELVLPDADSGPLVAELQSWQESFPTAHAARVLQGDIADAADSAIVVIAASDKRGPNETSRQFFRKNVELVRDIARRLNEHNFRGVLLVATNPVDVMAQAALEGSGLPASQVIGSGRVLDAEFYDELLARQTDPASGDSAKPKMIEPATWCAAHLGSRPTIDFCRPNCPEFGVMLESLGAARIKTTPGKSVPSATAGTCVIRICEAVLGDKRTVLPVCAMTTGQHGISGVFLNLRCVVGRSGVVEVIECKRPDPEIVKLKESVKILRQALEMLDNPVLTVKTS